MATANYTREIDNVGQKVIKWVLTDANDVGQAYPFSASYPDKNVQVIGTLGTTPNLKFQGCNEATPVNFNEVHDSNETVLDTVVALGFYQILENPVHFRPIKTAGTGMNLTILLCLSR